MASRHSLHRSMAAALLFGLVLVGNGSTFGLAAVEEPRDEEASPEVMGTTEDLDFFSPQYKVGVTYEQTSESKQTSKMMIAGQEMDQVIETDITNEMMVEDLPEGGKQISFEFTRVAMDMDSMGMTMHYDSSDKKSNSSPLFKALGALVGHKMTILVDDDYNVVETEQPEDTLQKLQSNEATKDLASPKQFVQTTRLAQSLPAHAVAPGDTWDFDLDFDEMMHFSGTGTLIGFNRDCQNGKEDCAEVRMEGSFDMNMEEIGDSLGKGSDAISEMMNSVKVTDGLMSTTMYFDIKDKFARFTETQTSMTMQMKNPMDGSIMEIPNEQLVKITVDMK